VVWLLMTLREIEATGTDVMAVKPNAEGRSMRVGPVRTRRVRLGIEKVHRVEAVAMAILLTDLTPGRKSQLKARLRAQLEHTDFWIDVTSRKAWIFFGAASIDAVIGKLNLLSAAAARGSEIFSFDAFDPEPAPRRGFKRG